MFFYFHSLARHPTNSSFCCIRRAGRHLVLPIRAGESAGCQKVSDYLVDAKVSLPEKSRQFVLTNADGDFTLKIPKNTQQPKINFSCMGYQNLTVDVAQLLQQPVVRLQASGRNLKEAVVRPTEPEALIRLAFERISQNYGQSPVAMTGFYREMIKRNSNYVSIAEAVFDIYKASYATLQSDRLRIYKGRKSMDTDKIDTLLIRYQGRRHHYAVARFGKEPERGAFRRKFPDGLHVQLRGHGNN